MGDARELDLTKAVDRLIALSHGTGVTGIDRVALAYDPDNDGDDDTNDPTDAQDATTDDGDGDNDEIEALLAAIASGQPLTPDQATMVRVLLSVAADTLGLSAMERMAIRNGNESMVALSVISRVKEYVRRGKNGQEIHVREHDRGSGNFPQQAHYSTPTILSMKDHELSSAIAKETHAPTKSALVAERHRRAIKYNGPRLGSTPASHAPLLKKSSGSGSGYGTQPYNPDHSLGAPKDPTKWSDALVGQVIAGGTRAEKDQALKEYARRGKALSGSGKKSLPTRLPNESAPAYVDKHLGHLMKADPKTLPPDVHAHMKKMGLIQHMKKKVGDALDESIRQSF